MLEKIEGVKMKITDEIKEILDNIYDIRNNNELKNEKNE